MDAVGTVVVVVVVVLEGHVVEMRGSCTLTCQSPCADGQSNDRRGPDGDYYTRLAQVGACMRGDNRFQLSCDWRLAMTPGVQPVTVVRPSPLAVRSHWT